MSSARLAGVRALLAVVGRRTTLGAEVERERPDLLDARDRGLFLEITAGVLRWRGELDFLLRRQCKRAVEDLQPEVRAVLRAGAYQLVHLDRVPVHAVVNEAVESIRQLGVGHAAGFVNGVLRGLTRVSEVARVLPQRPARGTDTAAALTYLTVTLSHPRWLATRWLARVGFDAAERWCQFNNAAPAMTIVARPGISTSALREQLEAHDIAVSPAPIVSSALRLAPGSLGRIPTELRVQFTVQDEGSQLVGHAVDVQEGDRVLDVCAAPGGKTSILRQGAGATGMVIAGDRLARLALIRASLGDERATPLVALDAATALPFGPVFGRVLLDAPCSGTGTLRRDPDVKWGRTDEDLPLLAATQLRMLRTAAGAVRPGGAVFYATCSSEPEENEAVVEAFLADAPAYRLEPVVLPPTLAAGADLIEPRGFLRTRPFRDGLDAYFLAKLVRVGPA